MADADLDVVIRQLAKQQHKSLMVAAKSRRDHYIGLAAKAKTKDAKDRYKQIAKDTMLQGAAAAKRLQISADNAADSYARSMRYAVEAAAAAAAAAANKLLDTKALEKRDDEKKGAGKKIVGKKAVEKNTAKTKSAKQANA